jgi:WD40 repeat protein
MGETLRVWNLQTGQTVGSQTTGHTAAVSAVCFSPKGDRIVTASDDGTARIWNAVTGRELHQLDHNSRWVRAATVSPDGTLVATSGLDDKVGIWHLETGKSVHLLKGHGKAGGWRALQFSADGSVLYSWGDDYKLREWVVVTGQLKRAFSLKRSGTHDGDALWAEEHQGFDEESIGEQCAGVGFRNGGNQLILAARDRYRIFDTATGREVGSHRAPLVSMMKENQPTTAPISALVCSETGNNILISSAAPYLSRRLPSGAWKGETLGSDKLTLVALGTGLPLWSTTLNGIGANPIALSPDGRLAADEMAGPRGASIAILDGKTGSLVRIIEGVDPQHNSYRQAAFSPDGNRLAVAQRDGTVLIWDLARLGLKSR